MTLFELGACVHAGAMMVQIGWRASPKTDWSRMVVEASLVPAPVFAQQVQVVVVAVYPRLSGSQPIMRSLAHEEGCGACRSKLGLGNI